VSECVDHQRDTRCDHDAKHRQDDRQLSVHSMTLHRSTRFQQATTAPVPAFDGPDYAPVWPDDRASSFIISAITRTQAPQTYAPCPAKNCSPRLFARLWVQPQKLQRGSDTSASSSTAAAYRPRLATFDAVRLRSETALPCRGGCAAAHCIACNR
jgi:hypothetical protein